ncbi:hypothetical protein SPBR_02222 [Sporothrix brasiliensis 5110]|uniref:TM7S3/TM198-like domain-containing protein n=1 Tax=Sporothrix brasiliensis 5110 TaxID=1398154 RepID=A0A0C2FPC4_9PEZI|nr:uncharacterized protein SPBR_02222 [Sporothrix brasiliensis 5110]KIH92923.1 hypothetical protein SPBR_02222 [Sporothrix brasiliensis 5110]
MLPTTTLTNSTSSLNTTLFNTTIPDGQLPLQPVVTPAWGVGGVLMLLTGVVYALVGIRNKMLHTFFSTAYLASLGTTVLVIYVMSPPISNAIQGAYLVAAVCTGLILGGIAIVFKEITEGFGCLLGGFCFSMWLLCVRQGGLLQSLSGIIIFIVAFTIGAYAFYFSHWTRQYALMACIAFGGATVTVMGIDTFSRAGLKEFWAYIWRLNDNLFPLGADTYPITKGIRVELAAIILLFLAGVVSQLKLWRLVQERRAKRDAERLEDEQKLAKEEEIVGRQVEAANARDREAWEASYGDGTYVPPPPATADDQHGSGDSGVGSMDSEKQTARSQTTSIYRQSRQPYSEGEGEPQEEAGSIEMADMQPSPQVSQQPKAAAEVVMEQDAQDGGVMVRVAQDEYPGGLPPQEPESRGSSRRMSAQNAGAAVVSSSPGIVPLPFKVPEGGAEDESDEINEKTRDDRSSVATFADEDEKTAAAAVSRRTSRTPTTLAKRFSQNSAGLLRSISQRSKRNSVVLDKNSPELGGQSQEELVSPRSSRMAFREDDDNSSLAVTMDGMSSDEGDDDRSTIRDGERNEKSKDIEVKPELSDGFANNDDDAASLKPPRKVIADSKHISAVTVSTEILEVTSSTSAGEAKTTEATETHDITDLPPKSPTVPAAKSTVSVDSVPAMLTKDRLPRSLSRVAMSYRTNEWAKHLSNAETPEFETLQLGEPQLPPTSPTTSTHTNTKRASGTGETPVASPVVDDGEAPAPLNVVHLQQTAETGAPAPLAPRSASAMSSYGMLSQSKSYQSLGGQDSAALDGAGARGSHMSTASTAAAGVNSLGNGYRSISASQLTNRVSGLQNEPIAEENDAATKADGAGEGSEEAMPKTVSSPFPSRGSMQAVPGVVSFNAPQTLIGQRDMLLRSKSQQGMYIGGSIVNSASMASLTTAGNTGSMTMLPGAGVVPSSGASDGGSGSIYNFYPGSGAVGPASNVDLDDLPMNQRRELMRNSSLMSLSRPDSINAGYFGHYNGGLPVSMSTPAIVNNGVSTPTAGSVPFDSHQPKRDQAHLPTAAARQAQLATFRSSVAADLRSGAAVTKSNRESLTSPYLNSNNGFASPPTGYGREQEVQQNINLQRNFLMGQKEAEAQRRELERAEKERNERAFEERMRRGDLLEAHRDAMRRMQASAGK